MSFDMNVPRNLSNVQASHKSCSGGGGNTGYFRRDGGSEEEKLEFAKDMENDSFVKTNSDENEENISFIDMLFDLYNKIIDKLKKIFKIK